MSNRRTIATKRPWNERDLGTINIAYVHSFLGFGTNRVRSAENARKQMRYRPTDRPANRPTDRLDKHSRVHATEKEKQEKRENSFR